MRLTGGPSNREGQLEVQLTAGGKWGSVCGSSWVEDVAAAARVTCRHLGMGGGVPRMGGLYTPEGSSDVPPALTSVRCSGNETELAACSFAGTGEPTCSYPGALGVACEGTLHRGL